MLLPMGYEVADRARFDLEYAYFLPWKNAVVGDLEAMGARVHCLNRRSGPSILAGVPQLSKLLTDRGIDLVHAHLPIAGVAARLAGLMAGIPVVYTEHNLQERYASATRLLNRWTWARQAAVIAVSRDVAASIATNVGDIVPTHVVLNGVNAWRFAPGLVSGTPVRHRFGIPGKVPVIGTVAVFRVQKRLDHWLVVARKVLDARPDTHFLLVGDGPERQRIIQSAQAMGLSEAVHWVGLHEDVRPFVAAMDVYLMTSEFEGLPIALLESMAMGVPPVVTAVGGIPEVVKDGVSGFVAPFGSIDQLSLAAVRLINDAGLRDGFATKAREDVQARFSMERMQKELESIYDSIAQDRGRSGTPI